MFFYSFLFLLGIVLIFGFNIQLYTRRIIFLSNLLTDIDSFNIYTFLLTLQAYDIRGALYAEGIDLFLKSPYFGYGSIAPQTLEMFGGIINDFHNSIISMLVSYGLFGSILYVFSLLFTLKLIKIDQQYIYILIIYFFVSMVQPIHLNIQFSMLLALFLSYQNTRGKIK
jgi:O-antigen ligase